MDEREIVIDVWGLVRKYHSPTEVLHQKRREMVAVDHIDLQVRRGELFGLLGPNSAGKTTTIKVLTTLLLPTEGGVQVMGYDAVKQPMEVRKRIGLILRGERGLYYRITARQNLRYFADIYGVPIAIRDKRSEEVLARVDHLDKADVGVEDPSRGMKQRLHIAKDIVHDQGAGGRGEDHPPDHHMYEADELCDRVGVIARGRVLALDTPSGLKALVKDTSVIGVEGFGLTEMDVESLRALEGVGTVAANMGEDKQTMRVQVEGLGAMLPRVAHILEDRKVIGMKVKEPTLEDAYLWPLRGNA